MTQSEGDKETTFTIPPPTPNNPATRPANVSNVQATVQTCSAIVTRHQQQTFSGLTRLKLHTKFARPASTDGTLGLAWTWQ